MAGIPVKVQTEQPSPFGCRNVMSKAACAASAANRQVGMPLGVRSVCLSRRWCLPSETSSLKFVLFVQTPLCPPAASRLSLDGQASSSSRPERPSAADRQATPDPIAPAPAAALPRACFSTPSQTTKARTLDAGQSVAESCIPPTQPSFLTRAAPSRLPNVESDNNTRVADSLLHSLQSGESPPTLSRPQSTAAANISAQPTPHPTPYAAPGSPPRHAPNRMRSSIACIRCRRSKVKCVNNGVSTTCRACENSGRECQYPPPVEGAPRRRASISGRADGAGDGDRRQRSRKSVHGYVSGHGYGLRESPRPHLDALDPRVLTPQVWQELFDIFQIHYSADLPFLHPPTFLKPLRQAATRPPSLSTPNDSASHARPPASDEFLLAFLALTARSHPKLVAHHSPPTSARSSNPLIASEYYAAAANERLSRGWSDSAGPDIERVQAMLMMGLHSWGMCRGATAWLAIGNAIRSAQAMGLQFEDSLDDEPLSRSVALSGEAERLGLDSRDSDSDAKDDGDRFIQQEIRRRTFWSCFIMDRYLSSGKYRPQMLHATDLRIQLPASERSFLFAEKVRTLMLGEEDNRVGRAELQNNRQASILLGTTETPEPKMAPSPNSVAINGPDDEPSRLESGADEGLVSRYIKILDIYGQVIKWSCAGGRRTEEHPPWNPRCRFHQLRKECQIFKASLPRQHALTPQNTQAHISLKTSTPYTLVHTVYLLAQIMLHREYVPFLPIRCSKPEGPLDAPTFPADKYDVPHGFWEESARECFKAARDVVELVRSCQEWNALVETPIVGFTIYTVAFVGVYCINFPWMDPDGFMCTKPGSDGQNGAKSGESKGFVAARKALEMVGQMRPRLQMADGWFKTITRIHKYMRRMKSDYRKNTSSGESATSGSDNSPLSSRHLSLREGGAGGGLDEYKLLERTLKDFGILEDQDVEMQDAGHRPGGRPLDAVYDDSRSGTTVKSEDADNRAPTSGEPTLSRSESGPWNAINATPGAPKPRDDTSTPTNGQFRSYETYHQTRPGYLQQPPSSQHSQQPQLPGYPQQINGFRPMYSPHDNVAAAGRPPSLTSPASHSATTPSEPSPGFQRPPQQQHQPYGSWAAHSASATPYHHMHPPAAPPQAPQMPYSNGMPSPAQHQPQSVGHAYPTPAQSHTPQQMQPPVPMHQQAVPHQLWNPMEKEAWLDSLHTGLGGDDVAAFVDGDDFAEWAAMSNSRGFGGGWLSQVWGPGAPGAQ